MKRLDREKLFNKKINNYLPCIQLKINKTLKEQHKNKLNSINISNKQDYLKRFEIINYEGTMRMRQITR